MVTADRQPGPPQLYTVAGQVVTVYQGGYQAAVTIANLGSNTLYVSASQNVNAVNGFPISGGSSMIWDAGRDLYMVATGALPCSVAIVENSGQYLNVQALANQIVASGLATQIATQIALKGAPPLNTFDTIANAVTVIIPAANVFTIGTWDVRKYNAVRWLDSYILAASLVPGSIRELDFIWLLDNNGAPGAAIDQEIYYTWSGLSGTQQSITQVVTPIKGSWLRVIAQAEAGGGSPSPSGGFFSYALTGQYLNVGDPLTISAFYGWQANSGWVGSQTNDGDNFWYLTGAKVNGVTITDFPPIQSGPVSWQVSISAVTVGQIQVQLLDSVNNQVIDQFTFPVAAAGASQQRNIIMPNRLVSLRVIGGAAATVAVSMSSQPR